GVKYIKHAQCMGACAARNTGLRAASGEFIAYLDDDDEWLPEKTAVQLEAFTDDRIALVYCDAYEVDDTTGNKKVCKRKMLRERIFDELIFDNFVGGTSFPLLRRSALLEVGGFDVQMPSAQDFDTWLRLAEKYEVNCIDKPLVLYHVHSGDQISKVPKKKIAGLERLNDKNLDYLRSHPSAYATRLLKMTPYYVMDGQSKKALSVWRKAVSVSPLRVRQNLRYLASIVKQTVVRPK
ncbi:MAG: glycosyltransferase, partial [Oscillospiraceae bacterium]|nr:glycosyltransferase [Oscillospiraceae bacterium]